MPNICHLLDSQSLLLQLTPPLLGLWFPKRGGVNCKEQRLRVEKMANIRHDLKEGVSSRFMWNTILKQKGVF